jgi:hypothetical protein
MESCVKLRCFWMPLAAALLLVWSSAPAARAATLDVVDGELVGAFGVMVNGNLYDVQFREESCPELYDGCDELSDFPFTTSGEANYAALALFGQVLTGTYDDFPELTAGCENLTICNIATPYGPPVPNGELNVLPASAARNASTTGTDTIGFYSLEDGAQLPYPKWVWAVWTRVPDCANGLDDDGDLAIDYPADPDCRSLDDLSEEPDCSDGIDNDDDGWVDHPDDPACSSPTAQIESRACQDGIDNDGDLRKDFDGGQSIFGSCGGGSCPPGVSDVDGDGVADPDLNCGSATDNREAAGSGGGCGIGPELAFLLPALWGLRRRATRRSALQR